RRDGDHLVLTQQRFTFGESPDDTTWLIPVHVRNGSASQRILLDAASTRVPLSDADAPIVVNAGGHGFFRVAYSDELLGRLAGPALAELDTLERYNLVDDAWSSVGARRLAAGDFRRCVGGFADEREAAVWQAILVGLRGMGRLLGDDDFARFQGRVAALLRPVVADLGDPVDDEPDLTGKLRGSLVAALAV